MPPPEDRGLLTYERNWEFSLCTSIKSNYASAFVIWHETRVFLKGTLIWMAPIRTRGDVGRPYAKVFDIEFNFSILPSGYVVGGRLEELFQRITKSWISVTIKFSICVINIIVIVFVENIMDGHKPLQRGMYSKI